MNAKTHEEIFQASKAANTHPAAGETRDCIDPWFQPFIQTNGDVQPCCWFYAALGNVNQEPFDNIINGIEFRKLRRELLTGELRHNCIVCPSRGITRPQDLLRRLREKKAL